MKPFRQIALIVAAVVFCGWRFTPHTVADEPEAAARGYRFLTEVPVLPGDFQQSTFDHLWTVWPEPLRSEAEKATPERRRQMAFDRYGLTTRPGDESGKPLQYVVDNVAGGR